MIKEVSKHPVLWNGATTKTLTGTTPEVSDVIDLRMEDVKGLLCQTAGEAGHDGTGTTFRLIPCNEDGSIIYDDVADRFMSTVPAATGSAITYYSAAVPILTTGGISIPLPHCSTDWAIVECVGGDAAKEVVVRCDLLVERG